MVLEKGHSSLKGIIQSRGNGLRGFVVASTGGKQNSGNERKLFDIREGEEICCLPFVKEGRDGCQMLEFSDRTWSFRS